MKRLTSRLDLKITPRDLAALDQLAASKGLRRSDMIRALIIKATKHLPLNDAQPGEKDTHTR